MQKQVSQLNNKPVKITREQWSNFHNRIFPKVKEQQRFGQAFFNHFNDQFKQAEIYSWPELFGEREFSKAYFLIHSKVEIV